MFPTREVFREVEVTRSSGANYKVVNIYTRKGTNVFPKRRLCEAVSESGERVIVKAKSSGIITQVLVKVDDVIVDGSYIVEVKACGHTALMGNICCDCGVLLEEKDIPKDQAVSMLHSVPDLKIARNEARKLGQEDIRNLLRQRKLVLLVDLDQTLIHTTNDNIPPDLKDVYHFQLSQGGPWYHARLRPHTRQFLEKVSRLYELHISTFGVREYAHHIAHFLDPDRKLFGQRILSRNECLDLMSKKANLDSLFPCGDNLVCIIDDRTDVWNFAPNVVQVVPYHFFRHTGDINAPSGLQKNEDDDRTGIDFRRIRKEDLRYPDSTSANNEEEEDGKNYSSDSEGDEKESSKRDSRTDGCDNNDNEKCENTEKENGVEPEDTASKVEKKNLSEVKESSIIREKENECKLMVTQSESLEEKECIEGEAEESKDDSIDQSESSSITEKEIDKSKITDESDEQSTQSESISSEIDSTIETKEEIATKNLESESSKRKEDSVTENKKLESIQQTSEKPSSKYKRNEGQVFDVVDDDDYLLYLEDILEKIHGIFFKEYDIMQKEKLVKDSNGNKKELATEDEPLPDLKGIVPRIRKDVLKGINLVFSGVVPQQMKLRESKAYFIATNFGARVTDKMRPRGKGDDQGDTDWYTTHVVAANRHTEKVNAAKKHKYIKIVTPTWLWKCAERWEIVEEKLFPLTKESEVKIQRLPPHHCYFPEPIQQPSTPDSPAGHDSTLDDMENEEVVSAGPSARTRTPSGNLLEDVNPLIYFSSVERTSMTDEVEKILSDDDDDTDEDEGDVSENNVNSNEDDDEEEEEEEEEDDDDQPSRKKIKGNDDDDDEEMENEDELPSVIFRQGGDLPSDDSDDGGESDDEGDLSRMGADLESLLS
ncbi:hypothetical protein Pmani_034908 [Petrolisthes manimaculis]|uniref:RNA polymerase II subunit A C-terminal domain phosphatase n=1 Tax=Petrolisthes manimaculis TaxID=1843537 RepID=A0AAE1TP71_9EUCA|nr:hypothetical protein Pmani_034908 [Petrolisthes manimaculis]